MGESLPAIAALAGLVREGDLYVHHLRHVRTHTLSDSYTRALTRVHARTHTDLADTPPVVNLLDAAGSSWTLCGPGKSCQDLSCASNSMIGFLARIRIYFYILRRCTHRIMTLTVLQLRTPQAGIPRKIKRKSDKV